MLGIFVSIKDNFKLKSTSHSIDNWVFRFHYRATTILFLIATILVTCREYIGEHIHCLNDMKKDGFSKVIDTYCFFTSTFTILNDYEVDFIRSGHHRVPPPGLGPLDTGKSVRRHYYYQWVPFFLFGQAIMFYLTHLLWKKMEGYGGRIHRLVSTLDWSSFSFLDKNVEVGDKTIPSKEERKLCIKRIKEAFMQRIILNNSWSYWLIFFEILNVLNVVFQVYITNVFLNKQFFSLGRNLISNGSKTLDEVFPKVSKCTFYTYGHSGTIQNHDALCILALNIINEKIYVFFWFWFAILFTLSCLAVLWRVLCIILYSRSYQFNKFVFDSILNKRFSHWQLNMIARNCSFPDWLLLKYLSKNMNKMVFKELLMSLHEDIEEKKPLCMLGQSNKAGNILGFGKFE